MARYIPPCLISLLALTACVHGKPFGVLTYEPVADVETIPQSTESIREVEFTPSDPKILQLRKEKFKKDFYSIWHRKKILSTQEEQLADAALNQGKYGENLQPRDEGWLKAQIDNANLDKIQSLNRPGIIVHNTNLRTLPTLAPCFELPAQAGEGFPFDYLQYSLLNLGEPVLISHYSKDGAWVFVETNTEALGWVRSSDVGFVSPRQIQEIEKKDLVVLTEDRSPIYYPMGRYWDESRIGEVLPLERQGGGAVSVLLPIPHGDSVEFRTVNLRKNLVLTRPLNFTQNEVSFVVAHFIGKPYGWGGILGNRDCASMIKDFYALFHILLPPTSKYQARRGESLDLSTLPASGKVEKLAKLGKPFQTLLYKKGHIGIYAGIRNGRPLLFHSFWGVKTKDGKTEGRNLVAKTAFTSLEYGKDLPFFDREKGSLLNSLESAVFLH